LAKELIPRQEYETLVGALKERIRSTQLEAFALSIASRCRCNRYRTDDLREAAEEHVCEGIVAADNAVN
jgi:hypothetical protein